MPAPQPKHNEILDKLVARMDSKVHLGEFEFASIRRDIDRLPQPVDLSIKRTLLALAYGAAGDAAQAKRHFESLLKDAPDTVTVLFYRSYLKRLHEYSHVFTLTYQYAEQFEEPMLAKEAFDIAFFFERDLSKSDYWLNRRLKYLSGDMYAKEQGETAQWAQELREKLALVELDEHYLPALSAIGHQVASEYHIELCRNNVYVHEGLLSLEFEVEPHAITEQQLNDANFELAMRIADDESLYNKPVTSFFGFSNHPLEAVIR